jgi:hypothetical protein
MLKGKTTPQQGAAGQAAITPSMSPTTATTLAMTAGSPAAASVGGATGSSSDKTNKAAVLLSALKPSSGKTNSVSSTNCTPTNAAAPVPVPVSAPIVTSGISPSADGLSNSEKSAHLLNLLKAAGNGNAKAAVSIDQQPSKTIPQAKAQAPTNGQSSPPAGSARTPIDEIRRAELMLKLIKPRATTVDDLLTDVDIAAKVKAAGAAPATAAASGAVSDKTLQGTADVAKGETSARSDKTLGSNKSSGKEETLLRIIKDATSSAALGNQDKSDRTRMSPSPTQFLAAQTAARASPVTVGYPPRPGDRHLAGSPPGSSNSSLAIAAAMYGFQGGSGGAAQRGQPTGRMHQRSPSASPVLTGLSGPSLPAPVSWASLSNSNIAASAPGTTNVAGASMPHSQSLNNLALSPSGVSAPVPVPARPAAPMLISPSDLRSRAAAAGSTR